MDVKTFQGENDLAEDPKEESDEEDEDDEESGRLRFKSERKDVTVVRVADAASKRRNIPETLGTTFDLMLIKGQQHVFIISSRKSTLDGYRSTD